MSIQSTSVTYTKDDSSSSGKIWVKLEQIVPSRILQFASLSSVYQLWLSAATGVSAKTVRVNGCPVEFDGTKIKVYLGFYSWPSTPTLDYSVSSAIGTIFSTTNVRKDREFSVFVDNASEIDLDFYLENASIVWESPCYDSEGSLIPTPTSTFYGNRVVFSRQVFGAARIKGKAVGKYHVNEMVLDKSLTTEQIPAEELKSAAQYSKNGIEYFIINPLSTTRQNSFRIENVENTITAKWLNLAKEVETVQLKLEVPQCVKDILSFCPGMYSYVLLWCDKSSTRQVYFNACTGKVIMVLNDVNPQRYCTKMVSLKDPGPWLHSLLGVNG